MLGLLLESFGQVDQRGRRAFEHLLAHFSGGCIKTTTHQLGQIAVQRTHWRTDGHVVVVEHHQQVAIGHPRIVQGLKRHARCHRAVADDGHRMALLALLTRGQGHAQGGRDAGRGVRRAKRIELTLVTPRKPRQAVALPQSGHLVPTSGQDFVGIGLVAHIPHQAVMGGVEDIVQRHRQFHRAQVGAQVTAGFGDAVEQISPEFIGQGAQLLARQLAQIGRGLKV